MEIRIEIPENYLDEQYKISVLKGHNLCETVTLPFNDKVNSEDTFWKIIKDIADEVPLTVRERDALNKNLDILLTFVCNNTITNNEHNEVIINE